MRKEDMVRLFIDPFPRDFFSLFLKLPDLFFLRGLSNGFFVTFKAGHEVGNSGKGLGFEEAVARVTFQPLFRMLLMVEGYRLLGPRDKAEADEKEKKYNPSGQSNEKGFQF